MIWSKIWACHDSHSLFFGYPITLMWILFGRHALFLTDLCMQSMVITFVRICGEVGGMFFCLAAYAASKAK
jgi:hypothetical protein